MKVITAFITEDKWEAKKMSDLGLEFCKVLPCFLFYSYMITNRYRKKSGEEKGHDFRQYYKVVAL